MAIWPLLALPLAFGQLESPAEASLLLGGLTTVVIVIPFMIAGSTNYETFMAFMFLAIFLVWAIAWLIPPLLLGGRLRKPGAIATVIGLQSSFAFIQAGVGVLALYGKSI